MSFWSKYVYICIYLYAWHSVLLLLVFMRNVIRWQNISKLNFKLVSAECVPLLFPFCVFKKKTTIEAAAAAVPFDLDRQNSFVMFLCVFVCETQPTRTQTHSSCLGFIFCVYEGWFFNVRGRNATWKISIQNIVPRILTPTLSKFVVLIYVNMLAYCTVCACTLLQKKWEFQCDKRRTSRTLLTDIQYDFIIAIMIVLLFKAKKKTSNSNNNKIKLKLMLQWPIDNDAEQIFTCRRLWFGATIHAVLTYPVHMSINLFQSHSLSLLSNAFGPVKSSRIAFSCQICYFESDT